MTLNNSGMYEVFSYPGLGVLVSSAVGGGSHAWAGALVEPQDPAYWQGRHPDLNHADVEKYYDKILTDMGAVRLSQAALASPLGMDPTASLARQHMSSCRPAATPGDQASILARARWGK